MTHFIHKSIITLHRILGTILSVLFLAWFLSGLVMIYHTFPRVSLEDRLVHMTPLSLDSIDLETPSSSADRILETAHQWCTSPIEKIDTLSEVDQWIPFGRLEKEMPIYKFHFRDTEKHQLYISSNTGEVLQFTTKEDRFWAWIGAIPHWVYFTQLRKDQRLWNDTVIWLSALGCIMCIAGIWIGIRNVIIARKKNKFTPYVKPWYKWHHILGFVFGLFVLTFVFSGMMSLASVPKWISTPTSTFHVRKIMGASNETQFILDRAEVIKTYPDAILRLDSSYIMGKPFYVARMIDTTLYIDASDTLVASLYIDKDFINGQVSRIYGDKDKIDILLMKDYDTYYISAKKKLDLPVWKVTIANDDNSCIYINPTTGAYKYVDNTSRWRHWMYPALHSGNIPGLATNKVAWNIIMWCLMLGGTVVSLTGVWLGLCYFKRLFRKLKKK